MKRKIAALMVLAMLINLHSVNISFANLSNSIFGGYDTHETFDSYSVKDGWIGAAASKVGVINAGDSSRGKVLRFTGSFNDNTPDIAIKKVDKVLTGNEIVFEAKFYNGTRCHKIRLVDSSITENTTADEMKTALELDLVDNSKSSILLNGVKMYEHDRTNQTDGSLPSGWFTIKSVLHMDTKKIDYKFTDYNDRLLAEGTTDFVNPDVSEIASVAFVAYKGTSGAALIDDVILTEMPGEIPSEKTYFEASMNSALTDWEENESCNYEVVSEDDSTYLNITPTGATGAVKTTFPVAVDCSTYVVEFDVKFASENSGNVQIYSNGFTHLGPTVMFDGTQIKTQTGGSSYVTMFEGAEAGKWYNVKLVADGMDKMYAYTTDKKTGITQRSTDKLERNLSRAYARCIVINALLAGSPISVDNMKAYKPDPDTIEIQSTNDRISIPIERYKNSAVFSLSKVMHKGTDITEYNPLTAGLVMFKLYDAETDLTDNMPQGITLDGKTGVLTVESTAQANKSYTVRALSYNGAGAAEYTIETVPTGEVAVIEFEQLPKNLSIPTEGEESHNISVIAKDEYNGVMPEPNLVWTLLDSGDEVITDDKISIANGVITIKSGYTGNGVKVKVASMSNDEVYKVSELIPVYQMNATRIEILGADNISLRNNTAQYTALIYDQNGKVMTNSKATFSLEAEYNGVEITNNGKLTIAESTLAGIVKIIASYGNISAVKEIVLYNPEIAEIIINGDKGIVIPQDGAVETKYTASAKDQYNNDIEAGTLQWTVDVYDAEGISINENVLTVRATAKEQSITIKAASTNCEGGYKVVISDQKYTYIPIDGGYQITNGNTNYVRPLYAPHMNDKLNGRRYIYYLGDRPKAVLSIGASSSSSAHLVKFGHMFLGINNGDESKWLEDMDNIVSRYVYGREEYEITDSSFEGTIKLTYTRSDKLDALLTKVELPEGLEDKLVVAVAGARGAAGGQPISGNSKGLEFNAIDTEGTEVSVEKGNFVIANNKDDLCGTSGGGVTYTVKNAEAYTSGIAGLLNSEAGNKPMVVGTTEGNTENEVYLMLTTESPANEYLDAYNNDAATLFDDGVEYYKSVSETVKIDTPNPYLNSAFTSQMMALDALWDDPVICHGPIAWHGGQSGWRSMYAFVTAGWDERIKTNVRQYIKNQTDEGRITNYPTSDRRYNMGEVLVDELMYYWLWTGDDEFFRDEAYDFVAKHLAWQDKYIQVPDTNLYENWLNAWNTDNKWNNGGPGSIATSYTWRAYEVMSQIAARLNKTEDAQKYKAKADAIKAEMKSELWDVHTGVYGEFKDIFGLGRLNTAPDLSSIYTPIDVGMTDKTEAYQMLRYSDYAIPSIEMNGYEFKYSSNRLPLFYSSDGLYQQEVMNNALAYYQTGNREMGYKQYMGCVIPLFKGTAAGPGESSLQVTSSLENAGHIDFGDTCSQYTRTAIEGIFGIKMNEAYGTAKIMPGLPADWKNASIKTDYLSYSYKHENNTDVFEITSANALEYELMIPTRSSTVKSVKVNGQKVQYELTDYVSFTTEALSNATVEIKYTDEETAKVIYNNTAAAKSEFTVGSNGVITEIYDPQGVINASAGLNSDTLKVTLAEKTEHHTFFVTVKKNDMTVQQAVDIEIKNPVEIEEVRVVSDSELAFKFKNYTEGTLNINAEISTTAGVLEKTAKIEPHSSNEEIIVLAQLTSGHNKITSKISGDYEGTAVGEIEDWTITANSDKFKTIALDEYVNQDLRTLHENSYDLTYEGNDHYMLPNFYFVSDSPRTVTSTGRVWWEDSSRGQNGVPASLNLPSDGGEYQTGANVPFDIASKNGKNAAFVSLYNQFPDSMNIPINEVGSKLYFMVSMSTNNMQSSFENARITVNMSDGSKEVLSLTNPDNIDDWLNYQQSKPYALSGYVQMLDTKAHSNILSLDLGKTKNIESIDFECLSNEVLAGLLGVTVVTGEMKEIKIGELSFNKTELNSGEEIKSQVNVDNDRDEDITACMVIALYDNEGRLKDVKYENKTFAANKSDVYEITYTLPQLGDKDYIKAFLWDSINEIRPLADSIEIG